MNYYAAGSTSIVDLLFLKDSTVTTGAGKTGLVYNAVGLTCYYKRSNGTASVAVTLADITTLGTFVSGGFKEVDGANMPGCYEFHPPDAVIACGTLGDQTAADATHIDLTGLIQPAPAVTNILVGSRVRVALGAGAAQERVITAYDGATFLATLERAWVVQPAPGDTAVVLSDDAGGGVREAVGLASANLDVQLSDKAGYALSALSAAGPA